MGGGTILGVIQVRLDARLRSRAGIGQKHDKSRVRTPSSSPLWCCGYGVRLPLSTGSRWDKLLKNMDDAYIEVLTNNINEVWDTGDVP